MQDIVEGDPWDWSIGDKKLSVRIWGNERNPALLEAVSQVKELGRHSFTIQLELDCHWSRCALCASIVAVWVPRDDGQPQCCDGPASGFEHFQPKSILLHKHTPISCNCTVLDAPVHQILSRWRSAMVYARHVVFDEKLSIFKCGQFPWTP